MRYRRAIELLDSLMSLANSETKMKCRGRIVRVSISTWVCKRRLFNFACNLWALAARNATCWIPYDCRLFRQHHHHIVRRISFENKQYGMVLCVCVCACLQREKLLKTHSHTHTICLQFWRKYYHTSGISATGTETPMEFIIISLCNNCFFGNMSSFYSSKTFSSSLSSPRMNES